MITKVEAARVGVNGCVLPVMRAQLEHLVDMADLPNVTAQVLPFSRGAHAGMFGPHLLLSLPRVSAMDVALTEPGVLPVRDSKDPAGAVLIFPAQAWAAFIRDVKAGHHA
ncbi:Scr1 family TA system antitoxin-like transcriptional regulator [Streptomyces sp. NPDC005393]|uniref:DUF397 domain-containing protein n=1 Tax=Streptomyces sp. NPDC005393 TaxID=3157041 RepID=UPI0033A5E245